MVKNPAANAGDGRDKGSIPGLGRSPGGGHGNPLQYSHPENPKDRGAWWTTVREVAKIRLKQLSTPTYHLHIHDCHDIFLTKAPSHHCEMSGNPLALACDIKTITSI